MHPYWEWTGRAAAVFFLLLLWAHMMEYRRTVHMTAAELTFGVAIAGMGALVSLHPAVPFAGGVASMACFGALTRLFVVWRRKADRVSQMNRKRSIHTFILDGELLPTALDRLGKDERWVNQVLQAYDIASVERVAVARIDDNERIVIDRKDSPRLLH